MDKLILEEIQRMNLLSKYDNSKTLSEQKVLTNPADKLNILPKATNPQANTATGKPIVANPANQFNVLPKGTNQQTNTATGKPMIYKQPNAADKFNQTQKSVGQSQSAINRTTVTQTGAPPASLKNIPDTSKGQALGKNKTASVGATSRQQASNKTAPVQLGDINGIKSFQDWLDTNAPGWATGYKGGVIDQGKGGGGYGNFGPRTQKAWQQYKDQYLEATSLQPIQSKGLKELPLTPPQEPQPVTLQPQQQVTYTKRR